MVLRSRRLASVLCLARRVPIIVQTRLQLRDQRVDRLGTLAQRAVEDRGDIPARSESCAAHGGGGLAVDAHLIRSVGKAGHAEQILRKLQRVRGFRCFS